MTTKSESLTDSYEELLLEQLQDPERAEGYLNAALADPDPRVFQLALQDVMKARARAPQTAEDLGQIQKQLSELGYQLKVTPLEVVSSDQ